MTAPLIAFLDALGRAPPAPDLDARIAALEVDAATRESLIARDAGALARAFGDTRTMWCWVMAPEEQPKPDADTPRDDPANEPGEPATPPDERPAPEPSP